jgi:copper(I)-binding protein
MMARWLFGVAVSLVLLTGCAAPASAGPKIRVEAAWARPAAIGAMSSTPEMQGMQGMSEGETNSAAYFVIVNEGSEADTLIGASCEVASKTEMHETRIENDVAQMMPVANVEIPAGGKVEFKPGGYHVMLGGLTQDLKVGDIIQVALQFARSGEITVEVAIKVEN